MGSKESESTVEVNVPAPSPEELELTEQGVELGRRQLQSIQRADQFLAQMFPGQFNELKGQADFNVGGTQGISQLGTQQAQGIVGQQGETFDRLFGLATSQPTATPEQQALIQQATDRALESGLSDISAFQDDALRSIREELAPSLGLRPDDTPNLDRGALVGREAVRQAGNLTSQLRGQQSLQELTLPLQVSQLQGGQLTNLANIAGATQQFQDQLRQQAFNNRLNLNAATGNLLVGRSQLGAPGNLLPTLTSARTAAADSTQTTTQPFDFAGAAGGIGGLLSGAGAVGLSFSDRRLKENVEHVVTLDDGVKLYRFTYVDDDAERVGVMADELIGLYPEAVYEHESGYLMVDYDKLPIHGGA